jgi:hypothetical protein
MVNHFNCCQTEYGLSNVIRTTDTPSGKMAPLWWFIAVFNRYYLACWQIPSMRSISTELNVSPLTHFLDFLYSRTGGLVSIIHPMDYNYPITIWHTSSYTTSIIIAIKNPRFTCISISSMDEDVSPVGRRWMPYANQLSELAASTGQLSPVAPAESKPISEPDQRPIDTP